MNLAVNIRLILYMCGWTALFLAGAMLAPALISVALDDGAAGVFVRSALMVAVLGAMLVLQGLGRRRREDIRSRDGLAAVGLAWLLIGLLGAVPYWLSGAAPNFWDGLFESFSGFSTTGASVLNSLSELPESILFWRALSHWLGGMGVIVLMLAVLPFLGFSGVQLFKNESTLGRKIQPRIAQTAKILWLIYLALTIILLVLLLAGGMNWFDALCHSLSGIATGGFSTRDLSIGHYDSAYNELVLTVFMFVGSLNFALYYQAVRGNPWALLKNTECRVFTFVVLIASLTVAASLIAAGVYEAEGPMTALRRAFFQVVSIISTTGFVTADWSGWPHLCQGILFVLFFVGGCSGSTSGGMKCVRWVLLFKGIHRTLRQHIHPRAVISVRLGGEAVPESMMTAVWSFGAIYFVALSLCTLILAALNIDLLTAVSASASALGNVGLGLGQVGPAENFAALPGLAKGVLCLAMFLGRLEFFALLILFLPDFWKK